MLASPAVPGLLFNVHSFDSKSCRKCHCEQPCNCSTS
ncbi:hypothetical protein V6Z12_D04G136700 [Gossypium hirsutum]